MQNKKVSLTIGIPAYNEEKNIKQLLKTILTQKLKLATLEKVIVASDGSTDHTVNRVNELNDSLILLIHDGERKGQAFRQNQIIEKTTSDILILLNADIAIKDESFIDKLVRHIINGADIASSNMDGLTPQVFFESIIVTGIRIKNSIFENINNGNNVYTCHGAARAFSKKFYENFKFTGSIGEDAYSYIYAMKNNFKYEYVPEATCYIRAVNNFKENLSQSVRMHNSVENFKSTYGKSYIENMYKIPLSISLKELGKALMIMPVKTSLYLTIVIITFISSFYVKSSDMWQIASSSKVLEN